MDSTTRVALQVADLSAGYHGVPVIDEISFTVPAQSITAVIGPSGCGKTTLLRCVAGLQPLLGGSVAIAEAGALRTVAGAKTFLPPERRSVGLVPQDGALFAHRSVAANIGFGLHRRRWNRTARRDRIDELLALTGLAELRDRSPSALSGGQRQRVALARALAPRPTIICLDEPFSALDAQLRATLRSQVREAILADAGTALLVTHDREEAMSIADEIVVLFSGAVRQVGSPQDIYAEPADLEVAHLFGRAADLPATASGDAATSPLGPVQLRRPATGEGRLLLRPGDLRHRADSPLNGIAVAAEFGGDLVYITASLPDGSRVHVATRPDRPPAIGEEFGIEVTGPVHFIAEQGAGRTVADTVSDNGRAPAGPAQPGSVSPPIGASTSPE